MPASTYYFLASGVTVGIFFLTWGILNDGRDDPWIPAGVIASGTMITAVAVREVIFRIRQENVFLEQKRLDSSFSVHSSARGAHGQDKLSVEQINALVDEIKKRSDAANMFGNQAENHRQVFLLGDEFLDVVQHQLSGVSVGSPRLAALTNGRRRVERIHRRHMLRWAEIEVFNSTNMARERMSPEQKIEDAERALEVVSVASAKYPYESVLNESADVLNDLIRSLRLGQMMETAERLEANGDAAAATDIYYEILKVLDEPGMNGGSDTELREIVLERLSVSRKPNDPQNLNDNFDLIG